MEIDDILSVKRVAERGSVHRAAADLGISQPALSKAIRRIEVSLGLKLFERTPRGMLLTPAGQTVYGRAVQLADWNLGMAADVSALKTADAGTLRVGVVPALVHPLLIPAAQTMLGQPGTRLSIRVQLSDGLMQLLARGEVDCAIAAVGQASPREFNCHILGKQRSLVVGRSGHPLLKRSFTAAELAAQDWVLPPKHIVLRQWTDQFLGQEADRGIPAVEVDATPAVLAPLIERTNLLTVMTEDALHSSTCRRLRALPSPAPTLDIEIGLFWRRTVPFSRLMDKFRDLIKSAYAER